MLHLIPRRWHRQGLRLAHRLRTGWWRVTRPRIVGCRILALDERGRVLLVRHSYGTRNWMPPGGGVQRGEEPIAAALRELGEETGCTLINPRLVAVREEKLHGATNVVHIVAGEASGKPRVDGREVTRAAFFPPDKLPIDMPRSLRTRMQRWVTEAIAARPDEAGPPHARPPAPTA